MRSLTLFICTLLFAACVDPIRLTSDNRDINQLVVEGTITDGPGPYTVTLSLSQDIFDNDLRKGSRYPVSHVYITDNLGNEEALTEVEGGVFKTKQGGIKGVVGRSYVLRIEAFDGTVFESTPEKLNPSGSLDSLYYRYETNEKGNQYSFYINSHLPAGDSTFVRWKFKPTYFIETRPDLHIELNKFTTVEEPKPFPCSGVTWIRSSNKLVSYGPCTCCQCWIQEPEPIPVVTDGQFIADGIVKDQFLGSIPVNYLTFHDKIVVDVIQTSLSYRNYVFWSSLKSQIEGSDNLFQPLYGTLPTNIFDKAGNKSAHGYFQAVSSQQKRIIITKDELPDRLPAPIPTYTIPCTDFDYSTTTKPTDWPE